MKKNKNTDIKLSGREMEADRLSRVNVLVVISTMTLSNRRFGYGLILSLI